MVYGYGLMVYIRVYESYKDMVKKNLKFQKPLLVYIIEILIYGLWL